MFNKSITYVYRIGLLSLLLAAFTTPSMHAFAAEYSKGALTDVSKIVKKVSPAVVKITSYDGWGESIGFGSGFIVDSDGVIVTNYHVVEKAERVEVMTKAGKTYQVSGVIDYNEKRDFAILKIQATKLPVISMGDASQLEVGQEVVAIGHPRGLEFSVSAGILSQRRTENDVTWLQHTASISPGSSGGPLVNTRSEVVGINTAYRTDGQQLNFAIPIDYIRASIERNTDVQYTVAGLRMDSQEQQQEVSGWLRSNFVQHEDRTGAFNILFPSQWQVDTKTAWSQDGLTAHSYTMFSPRNAESAIIDGYLSAGVRIHYQRPKQGYVFTYASSYEYGSYLVRKLSLFNPGFVLINQTPTMIGGVPMYVYQFAGRGSNMSEDEIATLFVFANEDVRVTIEMVAPLSEEEALNTLFRIMVHSFTVGN